MQASATMKMGGTTGALFAALQDCERGAWAHSPLYRWMVDNYAAMAQAITGKKVRWDRLSAAAIADGLTTRDGREPSGQTLRKTWYRVRKAIAALQEEREKAEAEAEARRAARAVRRAQEAADDAAKRASYEQGLKEMATRHYEELRARSASVLAPGVPASELAVPKPAPPPAVALASAPTERVRIGEVAKHITMRKQAPRYGTDALEPLPEPYVGPRPAGMPEDLPLEALMPLSASGRQSNGDLDFERMPGLPRRSFFERELEWAECCFSMIRAIPPLERNNALKAMFCAMDMKVNR